MNNSVTMYRVITVALVLAVIAAGFFLFARQAGEGAPPSDTSANTMTINPASTTISKTQSGVTGTGEFKVSLVSSDKLPPAPDFHAPIKFSVDVTPEIRAQLEKSSAILIGRIETDSTDLRSWIDLGTLRKIGGDYKGAEVIWQFVTRAAPDNSIAFENLGDLYQNFLKDYPKAETSFLAAIRVNAGDTNPYRSLFVLYSTVYKTGTSAAEDILKKGIAMNADALDFKVILARYYRDAGRAADARAAYDAAITAADKTGHTQLSADLKAEKAAVR